jgi:lipopolysaccharide transport system ATP-binding protein
MISVRFDRVTKSYPRHAGQLLLRQRMMSLLRGSRRERFCALQDVSFMLHQGQSLGIIGHNGAGKSTILNLVTRLCQPTAGTVTVEGRVAALLELGSGFHPDLTGTENVHINAALLGFTRKQTLERFDQIVDFSGIGDFLNEPLRTYSSGMIMRLAFAVAIHLDPEVLVIDEVLGVGDASFFEKCVQRISDFRHSGKTLVCVSHSLPMIQTLCDRAIWLDHGRVAEDGPATSVVQAYLESGTRLHPAAIGD